MTSIIKSEISKCIIIKGFAAPFSSLTEYTIIDILISKSIFFRSASFKEDEGTWKGNDDGKVVNNQPQRVMDDRNGLGPQGGYIAKLVFSNVLFLKRFPGSIINLLDIKIILFTFKLVFSSHILIVGGWRCK